VAKLLRLSLPVEVGAVTLASRYVDPLWIHAFPGLSAVFAALPGARLVGGCVRDRIAGRALTDIDLATSDPPERVMERLAEAGLRCIPTGLAHGTVTALSAGTGFEITTLRRDVETDGRHATVAFTDDWREDAARRDFTINAMSMTVDGEVFDHFGGLEDLAAGRVRFVGDPAARIAEDYLRILRYFRFVARYETQGGDAAALAAIAAGVPGLARLSPERVWSELKRILATPVADAALNLAERTGVLGAILPEARLRPVNDLPADPLVRLAAMLSGMGTLAERLRLSGAEAERLAALFGPVPDEDASDDDLRRALAGHDTKTLLDRAWLAGRGAALRGRISAMPVPVFPVQGRDLIAAGQQPGPGLGQELARLRGVWLESGCLLSQCELVSLSRR
jgi:poly(A) polymerase/tRNA nucleotidyltransferase (CCA-adding enzyme)